MNQQALTSKNRSAVVGLNQSLIELVKLRERIETLVGRNDRAEVSKAFFSCQVLINSIIRRMERE